MNKLEELLNSKKINDAISNTKLYEMLRKKQDPIEEKKHTLLFVLAIIGAIASVAAIAYAVYRFVSPNYLEDFDDYEDCDDLDDFADKKDSDK